MDEPPGKPNTHSQKNYDKYSVSQDFMNSYTIRSIDMYMSEENESLESGYAPRYLVEGKFHNVEKIPFKEQFEQLEKKFHDVAHSLVFEGIRLIVFAGTDYLDHPIVLLTIALYSSTEKNEESERTQEEKQEKKSRSEETAQDNLSCCACVQQLGSSQRNGRCTTETCRNQSANASRNTNLSRRVEEHCSSRHSPRAEHNSKLQQHTAGNSAAECRVTANFASSTGNSSDNFRGDRKQPRESSERKKAR